MSFEAHLYAVTTPGLEPVCAAELRELGAAHIKECPGGVRFGWEHHLDLRSNLWLRSASRVLAVLAGGRARSWNALERLVERVSWERWLEPRPLRIRVATSASRLYHQRGIRERIQALMERPVGEPGDPELWVRIHEDEVTISVDTSGALLHRRGYRLEGGKAPLRETLAAGILLASGWDPSTPLLDPMCGSGTFLVEGAWIAQRRAPGLTRAFAFEQRRGFRPKAWDSIREEARGRVLSEGLPEIVGVDIDEASVDAARANVGRAEAQASVEHASIRDVDADGPAGTIVVNPPYGRRLVQARSAFAAVQALAARLPAWNVVVLHALPGPIPPGWESVLHVRNGGLRVHVIARRPAARD